MSNRPTIPDLAKAAGVSVATVDRVLNRRLPVREVTVERVLQAAEAIGFHAAGLIRQRLKEGVPARSFGFLLQGRGDPFYQSFGEELVAAARARTDVRAKPVLEFVDELSPAVIAQRLSDLGQRVDALAVVSVDHPHVSLAIERLQARGIPTFALISDLTAEAKAAFIGQDSRKEGRTAAWMIAKTASGGPKGSTPGGPPGGKIAIIVGTHRYLCQETAEISFRSYFREHAPEFKLLEPLVNLEDARIALEATRELMEDNDDLVGLYICGGGMDGVIDAAREVRAERIERGRDLPPVAIVCNELSAKTRDALIDGILTAVISTRTGAVAARAVEAMVLAAGAPAPAQPSQILVPFDLFIAENV